MHKPLILIVLIVPAPSLYCMFIDTVSLKSGSKSPIIRMAKGELPKPNLEAFEKQIDPGYYRKHEEKLLNFQKKLNVLEASINHMKNYLATKPQPILAYHELLQFKGKFIEILANLDWDTARFHQYLDMLHKLRKKNLLEKVDNLVNKAEKRKLEYVEKLIRLPGYFIVEADTLNISAKKPLNDEQREQGRILLQTFLDTYNADVKQSKIIVSEVKEELATILREAYNTYYLN